MVKFQNKDPANLPIVSMLCNFASEKKVKLVKEISSPFQPDLMGGGFFTIFFIYFVEPSFYRSQRYLAN
jgi:hypothetical protein